jgi:hypothetical protein
MTSFRERGGAISFISLFELLHFGIGGISVDMSIPSRSRDADVRIEATKDTLQKDRGASKSLDAKQSGFR